MYIADIEGKNRFHSWFVLGDKKYKFLCESSFSIVYATDHKEILYLTVSPDKWIAHLLGKELDCILPITPIGIVFLYRGSKVQNFMAYTTSFLDNVSEETDDIFYDNIAEKVNNKLKEWNLQDIYENDVWEDNVGLYEDKIISYDPVCPREFKFWGSTSKSFVSMFE